MLHSVDHVTFLFSISLLDNPEWSADSPPAANGALGPHHRQSSEYFVPPSATRDAQRQVTIVLQGTPEVDCVQGQTIHSRWNCFLDVSDLTKQNGALSTGGSTGAGSSTAGSVAPPQQKQLYAPQPSHLSSLLPSQHSASGTPTPQTHHQHQLHYRNQSLPSSPQPQQAIQKGPALVRRVSSSSSPSNASGSNGHAHTRHSMGPNGFGDSRVRRSSFTHSTVSEGGPQRGALTSANRKSVVGSWGGGYGSRPVNENQGLAPVQESGPNHHSPVIGHAVATSETDSYEEDGLNSRHSGRPALSGGGLSPGLGLDLAAQALNGVTQGRPEHDSGDGIVVSFAGKKNQIMCSLDVLQ